MAPFPYLIHRDEGGMTLFVGLDVLLEKTANCGISEHGKIAREAQASDPEALACWIGYLDGTITVLGLEAGPLSQWFHRGRRACVWC